MESIPAKEACSLRAMPALLRPAGMLRTVIFNPSPEEVYDEVSKYFCAEQDECCEHDLQQGKGPLIRISVRDAQVVDQADDEHYKRDQVHHNQKPLQPMRALRVSRAISDAYLLHASLLQPVGCGKSAVHHVCDRSERERADDGEFHREMRREIREVERHVRGLGDGEAADQEE